MGERGKREKTEVEGHLRDSTKTEEGGCKMQGVGKEKARGRLGFGG